MNKHRLVTAALIISICMITDVNAKTNQFGISDIMIPSHISSQEKGDIIHERIKEELGDHFTLQYVLNFLANIQAFYDHLLDTNNDDQDAWNLLKFALMDMHKAKMSRYIKANTVTSADEHNLRVELGKLNRQINPLQ